MKQPLNESGEDNDKQIKPPVMLQQQASTKFQLERASERMEPNCQHYYLHRLVSKLGVRRNKCPFPMKIEEYHDSDLLISKTEGRTMSFMLNTYRRLHEKHRLC